MVQAAPRSDTRDALLDAAERLLVSVGYHRITTRAVAEEAGANHGLIHYYFGSMDELFVRVLERFTDRLIERQRALYSADVPFIEKWRTAMGFLEDDKESGYQKIWLELQALAWNKPELKSRVAKVDAEWRSVVTDALSQASDEYDLDASNFPLEAMVSLVMTFNLGVILERHSGVSRGHRELLDSIDKWLASLQSRREIAG